jgi:hypothetical protein
MEGNSCNHFKVLSQNFSVGSNEIYKNNFSWAILSVEQNLNWGSSRYKVRIVNLYTATVNLTYLHLNPG